ncbi:MAG TPA: methyltransferase domain-containing protein [Chitinophagaceae bacterium]|nr:methyltransferase domain-containing protein [Chitinophagaceae bacterium]
MRFQSYLHSAITVLQSYNGNEPFHLFIKKFFAADKKYGSRDRKHIASLCYNYFRLGHSADNIAVEEKILIATLLCENKPSAFLESLKPEWSSFIEKPLAEKLSILHSPFSIQNIFPFKDEISEGIDVEKFNLSFLIQPDLFLKIRPGNIKRVTGKLSGAGLSYKIVSEDCIAIPNSSKVDAVIELDKEAVVQDYNSQKVAGFIQLKAKNNKQPTVWDCCAASGGKSIMAYDINPNIELTVSDKRQSILENLKKRFAVAGIKKYYPFIADITTDNWQKETKKFDLIICDAPCTGSGTWSRTPEQLFYFKKDAIEKYAVLQKKILENVVSHLKPGGHLLYITCSVFKKENEDVVKYAEENFKLRLKRMELLKGYEMKADTLFAALFTAPGA